MDTITGGKPLTVEQHKQKLTELGITAIESISRMSFDSTKDNNGEFVSLHSDSNNDLRPAPAAAPDIIDLTTNRDAVHHASPQSQSVSKSNTQTEIEENCSVTDDMSPSEKHSSPEFATNDDPAVDDAANEDAGSVSPQRQSVLKSSASGMSPSEKHSSPASPTNASDEATDEDTGSTSPQRQSVSKSNKHVDISNPVDNLLAPTAMDNLVAAATEERRIRSRSQIRKATLRENEKQESENAKRKTDAAAIVKDFKQKNKRSRQIQRVTQEAVTKTRSKRIIKEREWAEVEAQALKNNPGEIKLMLLELAKVRRERDDLKNQLDHQNRTQRPRFTRHMSLKKEHHDAFLKYVEVLSKERLDNSDEFDTGFDTERWYNLNASEMKVRNYYAFEYIITHFTCVCVCVCVSNA